MPGKRPINKGSFAGHFDGLVTHFLIGRTSPRRIRVNASKPKRKAKSAAALNQFLFECASQVERAAAAQRLAGIRLFAQL